LRFLGRLLRTVDPSSVISGRTRFPFHTYAFKQAKQFPNSASDFEALTGEDVFQPVEGKIVGELAGYDEGQQTGAGQAFFYRSFRLSCCLDLWPVAFGLTSNTSVFLAYVLQPFKMARMIFNLPTLLCADLLALFSAAGAGALLGTQLVHEGGGRQVFELGQIATALALLQMTLRLLSWLLRLL
jgi:hypothetical protein